MRFQIFILPFMFCAALASSDVLVFTDADFQLQVVKHKVLLLEFYAPWCGHCKNLAPEYERAATILKRLDPPVHLAKIDCTVETETCSKFGVSGYPSLKIFKDGEFSKDFDGARETDAIVEEMTKEIEPASRVLVTLLDAQNFINKNTVGAIGFFDSDDNNEVKTFLKVADQLSYIRFGYTTSNEIRKELNQEEEQAVVLYRPKILHSQFEEAQVKTTEIRTAQLKSFLANEAFGLCAERTQGNAEYFEKPLIVAYFNVDYLKNAKGANYWRNRVMKVGQKLRKEGNKVYFSISNADEMSRELDECGIEDRGGDKPLICAWDSKNKRFRMDDVFSVESFEQFVRDFLAGKVKPYIKSEPVPASDDGYVKVVVADNFDAVVNDESKDVLIEFYAPWCGHCKTLAPKYEEVAKKLRKEKNIVIAKMDATANDVPSPYEVSGFPTIYFAPKNRKTSPKRYHGEREVNEIISYLASEATEDLIGYDRSGNKKAKKNKKDDLKIEL